MQLPGEATASATGRWRKARAGALIIAFLPLVIFLGALGLRLYGLDWDQGHLYHPDERAILMKVGDLSFPSPSDVGVLLDAEESPLNPRWFPYGSLPMYLIKGLTLPFSPFADWDIFQLRFLGRTLSALADTGTVMVVFLLGAYLYSRRVGLLAAALTGLAVVHIQLGHFYTVDTFLTFFIIASVYFMARVATGGGLRHSLGAGAFLGLALATKVSVAPLFLALAVAHLLALTSCGEGRYSLSNLTRPQVARALGGIALAIAAALATFFVTTPYAFLDWKTFVADVVEQSNMVRRVTDLPFTRQYIDTAPYLYHIRQLAVWGLGLPLGILAWLALPATFVAALMRRRAGDILILSWVVPYFILIGAFEVKFLRYLLPMTPFLILMASRMLFALREPLARMGSRLAVWVTVGIAALVVATGLYALAYMAIYAQEHPATRASEWINTHVPPGSTILREHWEESLPDLGRYNVVELPLYNNDTPQKRELLAQRLSQADYIVFYSNRLYGTIPRLPDRYPMTRTYYQALFSGELGYELVHYETSYPRLPGVATLNDTFSRPDLPTPQPLEGFHPEPLTFDWGFADESFTVYDHPTAMVFRKVEAKAPQEYLALLLPPREGQPRELGLMLSPARAAAQQAGGTWSKLFQPDSLANRFPLVVWLFFVEVVALATLPLALRLFRSLPDRGYLLAKPLGILLVAFIAWLLASLGWAPFSRASILLGLLVVGGVSLYFVRSRGPELREALQGRGRLFLIGEALFLAAFLAFFLLRMANPDLWHPFRGGEKPMDFAYLNAVVRSSYMPPYDPWFAGGYLNYYYFGQFIVATLIKATGIVPATAYNLAVPLLFALTVAGAFSLVYNLVASLPRAIQRAFAWRPLLAGLLAVLLVAVAANLDGLIQLAQGAWDVWVLHRPFDFDFWRSSRMMPPQISITEFPFFTFLFADLHAHLIVIPFDLLALGLGLTLVLGGREGRGFRGTLAALAVLALAVGALRAINTWDYPTFLALGLAAILIGEHARSRGLTPGVVIRWALMGGVLFGLGYLLFLPFNLNFHSFNNWVQASRWQTPLYQYLAIHGLFIFLILTFLAYEARHRLGELLPRGRSFSESGARGRPLLTFLGTIGIPLAAAAALALLGYQTVAFLTLLLVVIALLSVAHLSRHREDTPQSLFVLALLGMAVGLGILVDVVTVEGDIDRMNTVFKFYLQAWVLFGLVSAYALGRIGVLSEARGVVARMGRGLWLALFALLLFAVFVYPVLGTRDRLQDRFRVLPLTADGAAFMQEATYYDAKGPIELAWDLKAITWLQENVQGSPVILEGRTPLYRWGSRISVYTGLPTVLGWDWHQTQQRFDYAWAIEERKRDVETIYSTRDPEVATRLLKRYGVKYVVVGQVERLYYPEAGIAKFEAMDGQYLELAYPKPPHHNPQVRIYRVLPRERAEN